MTGCRVPSSEASRRTLKRRTEEIGRFRSLSSGGDSVVQLRAEVKSLTEEEREELLQQAGLPVVIPCNHSLAMKADLGIPWSKLRLLRRLASIKSTENKKVQLPCNNRWFKSLHVTIPSERQQRKLASDVVGIGDDLVAVNGAFSFPLDRAVGGGEEFRQVPFVYFPNMISLVANLVQQHERQVCIILYTTKYIHHNSSPTGLTWHNDAIPADQIWVKLGGDKGRGSFKFNLQLVNTEKPNSMKNTALVSVFKAGDSTTNLHVALDMYKEHVSEMQGMQIRYFTHLKVSP